MLTLAYWMFMVASACYVANEFHVRAWHNVMGYEKVEGEWQKTMAPDHYTFAFQIACYYMGAAVIILTIWAISSSLLLLTPLGIHTGLPLLIEHKFVIFRQCASF